MTSPRTDMDARRLRSALRAAFDGAEDLQAPPDLAERIRIQLRAAGGQPPRRAALSPRWLALAAGLVLGAVLGGGVFLYRTTVPVDTLARDAAGDHRNCALKFRLNRAPVPLEEAARRFDSAYDLLINTPADEITTPGGAARVVERHSCVYDGRRFGHVILHYRGRVVSLLVTAIDGGNRANRPAAPRVIGQPVDGLTVVSVNGERHAVLLVSDLDAGDLTQLSRTLSLPLAERMGALPDRGTPLALAIAPLLQQPK